MDETQKKKLLSNESPNGLVISTLVNIGSLVQERQSQHNGINVQV